MELLLRRCRARSRTASPAGLCLCLATATRCIAAFCLAAPAPLQELLGLAPLSSTSEGLASLRFSGAAGVGGVALLSSLVGEGAVEEGSADEELPPAEMECWRPTMDDVDRISWGKPARKKMTGSRGVPHRLNDEERMLYDMAHRKGFLEIGGSGWRKQRRGAPLLNTYRSSSDARAAPLVCLHKGKTGEDEVILDLSPLRTPQHFAEIARVCSAAHPGAKVEALELLAPSSGGGEEGGDAVLSLSEEAVKELLDAFLTQPIYRLPQWVISWELPRPEAKTLAKELAARFGTATKSKGETRARGMPGVKPGKSRRHGGYGIG